MSLHSPKYILPNRLFPLFEPLPFPPSNNLQIPLPISRRNDLHITSFLFELGVIPVDLDESLVWICGSADLPPTATAGVKAFEEPDEGVDEGDPEEDF